MWNPFKKRIEGKILPQKNVSYVVDENGEPMLVFYRQNSKLFVNRPLASDTIGYLLNIRHPLLLNVAGQDRVDIPPIPAECDGIILVGYGTHNSTAFIVRNFETQTMEFPL